MIEMIISGLISFVNFVLYLKSSLQKLRNPYALNLVVQGYDVVSPRAAGYLAPLLAVIELLVAVWLILPWTRLAGAVGGALLQLIFIAMMLKTLGRTLEHGCGCFELNQPKTITMRHVYFNLTQFLALSILAYLQY